MKIYKLDPIKFSKERNRLIIVLLIFILFVSAIVLFNLDYENVEHPFYMVMTLIGIIGIAISIGAYKGIMIRKKKWLSYELNIGRNFILLKHEDINGLEIYFEEITRICEQQNRNIIIRTSEKNKIINIPEDLQGFAEVTKLLKTIVPIEKEANKPLIETLLPSIMVVMIIGIAIVVISDNIKFVLPAAAIVIPIEIWALVETQRNKFIDPKLKKQSLFLIFIIVMMLIKVYQLFNK